MSMCSDTWCANIAVLSLFHISVDHWTWFTDEPFVFNSFRYAVEIQLPSYFKTREKCLDVFQSRLHSRSRLQRTHIYNDLYVKIIYSNVKKFGYNGQFLLQLFGRCQREPAYYIYTILSNVSFKLYLILLTITTLDWCPVNTVLKGIFTVLS